MLLPVGLQIILALSACFYAVVTAGLLLGLRRLAFKPSTATPLVSVIVAARNEAENIGNLLNCLVRQDYDNLEIIVVNDRSNDQTASIIEQFCADHPKIHLLNVTSFLPGMPYKKNALAQGIAASKGTILCFTDADCLPPVRWVSLMVSAFGDGVGLAAGYSPYSATSLQRPAASPLVSLLHRFIEYEELKGAIWAAGSIGLNKSWLCTGRSLAYRREVYNEVGGFDKIRESVSGDDDLFIQLVRRETSWDMRYVTSPESFVPTVPPATFADFVRQRTRHFSAGKFFPPQMKAFFFFFHASNLLMLAAFAASFFMDYPRSLIVPYLCKCIVDAILFTRVAPTFRMTSFASSFIVMEMLYVIYNSCVGPLGFLRKFDWKPAASL
jgi:cellulose synthase/poly-beta-1,6-N-acetylglucosamine synthase-like glycosyltransferase